MKHNGFNWLRRVLSIALCAAALAPMVTTRAAEPQSCDRVRMAGPGWADIDATNAISGIVLKALGYQQSVENLSVPITYE